MLMIPEPHPDTLSAYQQAKAFTRGSMQAADDTAIKAYHKAIDEGRSRQEAEQQYFETYTKFYDGTNTTAMEGDKRRIARKAREAEL